MTTLNEPVASRAAVVSRPALWRAAGGGGAGDGGVGTAGQR